MLFKEAGKIERVVISHRQRGFGHIVVSLLEQIHGPLKPQTDEESQRG
jgi:hypothetical protein